MHHSSAVGFDLHGVDLRSAVDGLRDAFTSLVGESSHRDIRSAILIELAEEPMHGYQLIQAIEQRAGGRWTPAPGSVYPTLQLLADEGLATAAQDGERKVYTLTKTGKTAAAALADDSASPGPSRRGWNPQRAAIPKAGVKLAEALGQVATNGSEEQQERAVAIIDEARKKLYAILAED